MLPGSTPLDEGRDAFERGWGVPLPRTRGLHMLEMMDAAAAGRLKALWAIGYDVFLTNPNATETARALQSLELVIVQDLFLTETAREFGSVFLPACSSFEKDGTFMNAERRIQRVRAALRPVGGSKPDWQILCEIARAMGGQRIRVQRARKRSGTKCGRSAQAARGMTYARLDAGGLQWPCPAEDHPARRSCTATRSALARAPRCRRWSYRPSPETVSAALSAPADHGPVALSVQRRHDDRPHANNELRPSRPARHVAGRRQRGRISATAIACGW